MNTNNWLNDNKKSVSKQDLEVNESFSAVNVVEDIIADYKIKDPLFNKKIEIAFKKFKKTIFNAWNWEEPFLIVQRAIVTWTKQDVIELLLDLYPDKDEYRDSIESSIDWIKSYFKRKKINKQNFVDLINYDYDCNNLSVEKSELYAYFIKNNLLDYWEDFNLSMKNLDRSGLNYKLLFTYWDRKETFTFPFYEKDDNIWRKPSLSEIFYSLVNAFDRFENIETDGLAKIELVWEDKFKKLQEEELATLLKQI